MNVYHTWLDPWSQPYHLPALTSEIKDHYQALQSGAIRLEEIPTN